MARAANKAPETADHNIDRYPSVREGLQRILDHGYFESAYIDRLEVRFLANGECTYRYWEPRADDSDGGVIPAP